MLRRKPKIKKVVMAGVIMHTTSHTVEILYKTWCDIKIYRERHPEIHGQLCRIFYHADGLDKNMVDLYVSVDTQVIKRMKKSINRCETFKLDNFHTIHGVKTQRDSKHGQ